MQELPVPGFAPILDVPSERAPKVTVVAGIRAVAMVSGSGDFAMNLSAAPVELFKRVEFREAGCCTAVRVYPNHVEKTYEKDGHRSTWILFSASNAPWFGVIIAYRDKAPDFTLDVIMEPHLDYISKFHGRTNNTGRIREERIEVTAADHPEITAAAVTSGRWESFTTGDTIRAGLRFSGRVGFVAFAGGLTSAVALLLDSLDIDTVLEELRRVYTECSDTLAEGAQLETPVPEINRFFTLSRIWFIKARRMLPFGPPYTTDASRNSEIEVLTASPDYHGVFANDNVQTSLEGMIVCPRLRAVYENDCDVLLNHRRNCSGYIPEAVEFFKGGTELFIQGLRIGQHPEWIASVAALALLTGDGELGRRFWEGIEFALTFFRDSNGDGVGEWDISGYPEQPDTTGYRSGMLYAQAWWVWAFDLSSELAAFLHMNRRADELRLRRDAARMSMERVFGTDYGYGSWLSDTGELHPHKGHCMIIPVALGLSPKARARAVLETVQSAEMWEEPHGTLRANRTSGINGGRWVWAFMRWNLVAALFRSGYADRAAELAERWARSELSTGLPAPESFPTPITGITGEGYVWTAGRAIRALSSGLFGMHLTARGLSFKPNLPAGWREAALVDLPFRECSLTIRVRRGDAGLHRLNGKGISGAIVLADHLVKGKNEAEIGVE